MSRDTTTSCVTAPDGAAHQVDVRLEVMFGAARARGTAGARAPVLTAELDKRGIDALAVIGMHDVEIAARRLDRVAEFALVAWRSRIATAPALSSSAT